MNLEAFAGAFGLIFLAEMGDKTQLAVMALAARHRWQRVLGGAMLAFAVLNVAAVAVGQALARWLDPFWVGVGAASLFALLGIAALLGADEEEDAAEEKPATHSIFWSSFGLILFAELGDKTQLATAGLAARDAALVEVFLGSTLALWGVSLVGVFLGRKVLARMPARWVRRGAGVLFLAFAAATFYELLS